MRRQEDPSGRPAAEGALVLFSGGQDSTVCLAWALDRFERVETVGFDYRQRHRIELECRAPLRARLAALDPHWAARLGEDHLIDLAALGAVSETAMTRETAIALDADSLPNTFVPGRNLIFFTFAAAIAWRRGLRHLIGGMCETDYSGYPDCRDDTIKALQVALNLGMDRRFVLHTPLMWIDKAATWRLAQRLGGEPLVGVIVEATHSCYLGDRSTRAEWGYGCGDCPACRLRAEGYRRFRAGLADPGSAATRSGQRPLRRARFGRLSGAQPMTLPASRQWWDLSTRQFAALDMEPVVAILPVGAVEQHGPHLPVRVDAAINAGILARAVALMPPALPALILPAMPVGKSDEHLAFPGTLSLPFDLLARLWIELARSAWRAGVRRIILFNAHGGQPQVMEIVCRELRVQLGMFAVGASWFRTIDSSDLFSPGELRHGIHGGEVETSMMLHLHPDLVDMTQAADFVPRSVALEQADGMLTPEGRIGFGWQTQDLHPAGACGNAAAADAARGAALVERAARALVALVQEVHAYPLEAMTERTAFSRV